MKYVFVLSKENIRLARAEVQSLFRSRGILYGNLLLVTAQQKEIEKYAKRLAYTKSVHRLLFRCQRNNLNKYFASFDWNSIYTQNFSLRIPDFSQSEKKLSGHIWNSLQKPKVNLKNPQTAIFVFYHHDFAFCCVQLQDLEQDFQSRKAHKRPYNHPTSLDPKLARCMINLIGIRSGTVVDAFCGSGGILLEAGLMGLQIKGFDIDPLMLQKARTNLSHYGLKHFVLEKADATQLQKPVDYFVSDLPYGLNTKQTDLDTLYHSFISRLRPFLRKRAVLIFPRFRKKNFNYSRILKKKGFTVVHSFEQYIHKSLSKKIFVIE